MSLYLHGSKFGMGTGPSGAVHALYAFDHHRVSRMTCCGKNSKSRPMAVETIVFLDGSGPVMLPKRPLLKRLTCGLCRNVVLAYIERERARSR